MAFGKTIELYLVNGTADSIVTAELSNWNGKAIKIPRIEVSSCKRADICDAADGYGLAEAGKPGDDLVEYYRARAKGTALIIVEHEYISV